MSDEPKDPPNPQDSVVDASEPTDAEGAGNVLPLTRFLLNEVKGLRKRKKREVERLEDGTLVLSRGRGWAHWLFGTYPIYQSTCLACLRQRREDNHERCEFEDCDCFCMQGKHWPLWALLGLEPPPGKMPEQIARRIPGNAEPDTAPRPPQRDAVSALARYGRPALFAAMTVSTLLLAVVAWEGFVPVAAGYLCTPTGVRTSGAPEPMTRPFNAAVPRGGDGAVDPGHEQPTEETAPAQEKVSHFEIGAPGLVSAGLDGGTAMAQLVQQATLMPKSPLPGQRSAPCPTGVEAVNGLCWLKLTVTPMLLKRGACENAAHYEPSEGWCQAHLAFYYPFFDTQRNAVDGQ